MLRHAHSSMRFCLTISLGINGVKSYGLKFLNHEYGINACTLKLFMWSTLFSVMDRYLVHYQTRESWLCLDSGSVGVKGLAKHLSLSVVKQEILIRFIVFRSGKEVGDFLTMTTSISSHRWHTSKMRSLQYSQLRRQLWKIKALCWNKKGSNGTH